MKYLSIATFKKNLVKYLGFVLRGEELIVLDRKTPLARVIPFHKKDNQELIFREALDNPLNLFKLKPKQSSKTLHDSLKFLKEERDGI